MIQYRIRSLVADLDGVVFQHPRLFQMVSDRAVQFTKKSINPYMSDQKAKKINQTLYKNFGHTVLGIQAIYNPDVSLKSFCDYVYDQDFLNCMDTVEKDSIFLEHQITMKQIINHYQQIEKPFYIFSNSPVQWCQNALEMMDISMSPNRIFGCDSPIYEQNMCLKPMKESYVKVSHWIETKEGYPYKTQFIYMDDQLINLTPILENPYWKPLWYSPNEMMYSKNIMTITHLEQLRLFI